MNIKELYWAAGFLEGEGWFYATKVTPSKRYYSLKVAATQVEKEPLDRLMPLFGGKVSGPFTKPSKPTSKPYHLWYIGGPAAAGVMMTLYSLMSVKRKAAIEKSLHDWKYLAPGRKSGDRSRDNGVSCRNGHPWISENIYSSPKGVKYCRPCHLTRGRKYREQKRKGGVL